MEAAYSSRSFTQPSVKLRFPLKYSTQLLHFAVIYSTVNSSITVFYENGSNPILEQNMLLFDAL